MLRLLVPPPTLYHYFAAGAGFTATITSRRPRADFSQLISRPRVGRNYYLPSRPRRIEDKAYFHFRAHATPKLEPILLGRFSRY